MVHMALMKHGGKVVVERSLINMFQSTRMLLKSSTFALLWVNRHQSAESDKQLARCKGTHSGTQHTQHGTRKSTAPYSKGTHGTGDTGVAHFAE